jgi:MoaD family protein
MPCEVRIPAPLQSFTGGKKSVDVKGGSVKSVLQELGARHEGLLERICESSGELRSFVNVYVNNRDIRTLDGLDTPIADGDEVFLVPAIAGG